MQKSKNNSLILVLILGSIAAIGPFTIDMYLPGFPKIAEDLTTTENAMSYTLTSYFIGIALGQLAYGPIIDKFGRKKPLMVGLSIFALASIGIAFSPNVLTMILLRFVQALGASVGMVASMSIVRDIYTGNDIAKMLSNIMLVMGVAPVIAPTLGSFLLETFHWEAIFVFLFVFSGLVILAIKFKLNETTGYNAKANFKFLPIVVNYFQTLQNTTFTKFTLSGSVAMAILFSYISSIPFILMKIYHVSEHTFGWLFGLNALGLILGSQVNRLALKRFSLVNLTNIIYFFIGLISLAMLVSANFMPISLVLFSVFVFLIMFLVGFLNPNAMALAMDNVDKNIGLASALNGSFRMTFGAVISAMIGIFYNGTIFTFLWFVFILCSLAFLLHHWAVTHLNKKTALA